MGNKRFGWFAYPLAGVLGFLPLIPIIWKSSPILNNDMLLAFFCYFWDFHRNWSWSNLFPFWSSSYQCGMPMHTDWQSGYLYPITWIFFGPISPHFGIYLFYAFHFALGLIGMLRLGPFLGLTHTASWWAGITFAFSGTILARYEHITFLAGWTWIPLIIALFLSLCRQPGPQSLFLYAIAIAMQCFGGHPQASLTTAMIIFAFSIFGFFHFFKATDKISAVRHSAWMVSGHILALLYCLPLLVPFIQVLPDSIRYDGVAMEDPHIGSDTKVENLKDRVFNFESFSTGAMRPLHLLSLASARAFGSPHNGSWWGGEVWGEVFLYLGVLGFLFCWIFRWNNVNRETRILVLLGLLGLWLSFGPHLGASQIQYNIPIFDNLRRPARFAILIVLALSVMSAHGFQKWISGEGRSRIFLFLSAAACLGAFAALLLHFFPQPVLDLAGSLKQLFTLNPDKDYSSKILILIDNWGLDMAMFGLSGWGLHYAAAQRKVRYPLLFLILLLDLMRIHWAHFYLFPADYYRKPPHALASFEEPPPLFWRVSHYLEYPGLQYWQMHNNPLSHWELFEREKNVLSYGIHAVFGFKHELAHLPLLWKWNPGTGSREKSVRYLLTNVDFGPPYHLANRQGEVRIYEREDWLPRIALVSDSNITGYSRSFLNLGRYEFPFSAPGKCDAGYFGLGKLCVQEPHDGLFRIKGDLAAGDTLRIRERYHPEWRYRIDGGSWRKPRESAEHFLEIPLEQAKVDEIEVKYIPFSFYFATIACLLASIAFFLLTRRIRHARQGASS